MNIDKVFETILRSSLFADSDDNTNIDPTTRGTNVDPTTPGTNVDPTTPGTNVDPTTPGTNVDPTNPGTNIDPTTPGNQPNFFGPYYFAVTLESLARYSTQLLESGSLDEFVAESKVTQHAADRQ